MKNKKYHSLVLLFLAFTLTIPVCSAAGGKKYSENISRSLFSDHRAYQVGDVVTILIVEYSIGQHEAGTETGSESEVGGSVVGSGDMSDLNMGGEAGWKNKFDGTGGTKREGSLEVVSHLARREAAGGRDGARLVATARAHELDATPAGHLLDSLRHDGLVEVLPVEPLPDKWRAFGWNVLEIDGHDMAQVVEALEMAKETKGVPTAIIAMTTKGKGVSFMENVPKWHGAAPCDEEAIIALNDIKGVAA